MSRASLTYTDYAELPEDGRRYELHEGELTVTPAPGTRHQLVKANLFDVLFHHVREGGLGVLLDAPVDCLLSETTVVQPDIVFVATRDASRVSERGIEGAPTLAVEVLSPSSEQADRQRKWQLYARHAIPHYWIVDAVARTIEAHELSGERYALVARLEREPRALPPFPGLRLDPAAVWV